MITKDNWNYLMDEQRKLDAGIMAKQGLKHVPVWKRVMAYKIEVAEAVNELKGVIKYWSVKEPQKELFLEETIDVLHFVLGIELALDKGYSFEHFQARYKHAQERLERLETNVECLAYEALTSNDHFDGIANLLMIAKTLGYDEGDVMKAYQVKNAVNVERSESGTY